MPCYLQHCRSNWRRRHNKNTSSVFIEHPRKGKYSGKKKKRRENMNSLAPLPIFSRELVFSFVSFSPAVHPIPDCHLVGCVFFSMFFFRCLPLHHFYRHRPANIIAFYLSLIKTQHTRIVPLIASMFAKKTPRKTLPPLHLHHF